MSAGASRRERATPSGGTPLREDAPRTQPFRMPPDVVPRRRPGAFITFEGIEGSGKTTQVSRLAERLLGLGEDVLATREPGGSPLGRRIRGLLLEDGVEPIAPLAELMLYAADRAQHLVDVVLPAIESGRIVLCDRFIDATLAYQGYGRRLGVDLVRRIHREPPLDTRPDRTILLDLEPELGIERALARNDEFGIARSEGRFEREHLDFHRRVRDGYLALAAAEPFRFRIVGAEHRPEVVAARIADLLSDLFPGLEDET